MITLPNGNLYRDKPSDPKEREGFILSTDEKILVQIFLPCKHRTQKACATCPSSPKVKTLPSCTLKHIDRKLNCVGCLQRQT